MKFHEERYLNDVVRFLYLPKVKIKMERRSSECQRKLIEEPLTLYNCHVDHGKTTLTIQRKYIEVEDLARKLYAKDQIDKVQREERNYNFNHTR